MRGMVEDASLSGILPERLKRTRMQEFDQKCSKICLGYYHGPPQWEGATFACIFPVLPMLSDPQIFDVPIYTK